MNKLPVKNLIILLLKTGLRNDLIATTCNISKETVNFWIKKLPNKYPLSRGVHIQPDGISNYGYRSRLAYIFFLVYKKVDEYTRLHHEHIKKERLLALNFSIAYFLFDEIREQYFKDFSSKSDFSKNITSSHLYYFLIFLKEKMIRIETCRNKLHETVEKVSGGHHCSCHAPPRNKVYWIELHNTTENVSSLLKSGELVDNNRIERCLRRITSDSFMESLSI